MLGWHLANNHPLPDGNKRCAFIAMIVFLQRNTVGWHPPDRSVEARSTVRTRHGPPANDGAVGAVHDVPSEEVNRLRRGRGPVGPIPKRLHRVATGDERRQRCAL